MVREDQVRMAHMLDAARSVARFIAGRQREDLDADEMLRFALVRAIQIIGEAADKVSAHSRPLVPDFPWREAVAMCHRLVHAYFDVNLDVLWKTATESVPAVKTQLEALNLGAE